MPKYKIYIWNKNINDLSSGRPKCQNCIEEGVIEIRVYHKMPFIYMLNIIIINLLRILS